ncbi:hypothetical protein GCM10023317_73870 [Actinopolymorpha pittospori]
MAGAAHGLLAVQAARLPDYLAMYSTAFAKVPQRHDREQWAGAESSGAYTASYGYGAVESGFERALRRKPDA